MNEIRKIDPEIAKFELETECCQLSEHPTISVDIRMNNVQQIDMNIIETKEFKSDELAKILEQSWTLKELPMISNTKS